MVEPREIFFMSFSKYSSGILILAAACAPGDNPAAVKTAAQPIKDFHFIEGGFSRGRGPDGNTMIYDAPGGLVVIDTGRHPGHSALILDYAKERGAPITAIVNTHWHLDHTTGNTDIKAAFPEAKVYATNAIESALPGFLALGAAKGEEMLATMPDLSAADRAELERGIKTIRQPAALLADIEVTGPTKIAVDGRELELSITDHAVTQADIWIWDPATKTAIVGDLVTAPAPFFDTACPSGWSAALDAVETKPFERVAAGHGALLNRSEYQTWRTAFDNLLACAAEKDGAGCADGWLVDAAPFIPDNQTDMARSMIVYYVNEIIRSPEKRAEFCRAG